jgi:O-antigen ligase
MDQHIKSKNQRTKSSNSQVGFQSLTFLLFFASLIVLYFNSKIHDPFSAPKFVILLISATWLLPQIIFKRNIFSSKNNGYPKTILVISAAFITSGVISALNAGIDYYSFFGDLQRRNGLITYFCYIVFLISAVVNFNIKNINKLYITLLSTGFIFSIYGILQISGNDFVNWSNPYNAIIGTLGNPNYAAAMLALFAALSISMAVMFEFKISTKIFLLSLSLMQIVLIYLSNSRQGLVSLGAAVLVTVYLKLLISKSSLSKYFGLISIFIVIMSILGMLQKGFLSALLFKESVSVRGYYWRAGLEMFKENPIFGIGIDQYGYFFREYREMNYSLLYGDAITSTNAHNVFIQHFATGGIFFGASYLLIILFVFYRAIVAIRKATGEVQRHITVLLSLWTLIQSISVVSIDNFGFTIWNYILSGAIISLSYTNISKFDLTSLNNNFTKETLKSFVTVLLLIPIVFVSVTLYRNESNMIKVRSLYGQINTGAGLVDFKHYGDKILKSRLIEPSYLVNTASYYAVAGERNKAFDVLESVVAKNPRNQDALFILADFNRQMMNSKEAVFYYERIAKIDPWNVTNYFSLAESQVAYGNIDGAKESIKIILSFTNKDFDKKRAAEFLSTLG